MNPTYIPLDVDDYKQRFKEGTEGHFLLDVRTLEEFEEARSPGAVLIPLNELSDRAQEVPTDQPIVVVCRSGNRSIMGAEILRYAGLKDMDIYNLEGGTRAWVMHGWAYDSGEA